MASISGLDLYRLTDDRTATASSSGSDFSISKQGIKLPYSRKKLVSRRGIPAQKASQSKLMPRQDESVSGIDLWILPNDRMEQFLQAQSCLSRVELSRSNQINHEFHARRYKAVRVLLRMALSVKTKYETGYNDWHFSTNAFGKPELNPQNAGVSFSITHTEDFSALAVATGAKTGIDAEKVNPARGKHLPKQLLTEYETQRLQTHTKYRQFYDFLCIWTLKEAYSKALGLGFSLEFSNIEFELDPVKLRRAVPERNSSGKAEFEILNIHWKNQDYLLSICTICQETEHSDRTIDTINIID